MLPGLDQADDLARRALFVVLMHRHRAGADPQRIEKMPRVTGVLGGDHVDLSQHTGRAPAYIGQVPERRSHHVQ